MPDLSVLVPWITTPTLATFAHPGRVGEIGWTQNHLFWRKPPCHLAVEESCHVPVPISGGCLLSSLPACDDGGIYLIY